MRVSKKLANGQYVYLEVRSGKFLDTNQVYKFILLVIADSKKEARGWLSTKRTGSSKITGKPGSIEGLTWAAQVIKEYVNTHLSLGIWLIVDGEDDRRFSAYKRYLVRREGFLLSACKEFVYIVK